MANNKYRTREERLLANSYIPEGSDCWVWIGKRKTNNRGQHYGALNVYIKGQVKTVAAHRWAYEVFKGQRPGKWVIRHQCGNTLCINPAHLLRGTQAQNVADAYRDGTHVNVRGEVL